MICSLDGKTCGACCWSPRLTRAELAEKLRRHRRLFRETKPTRPLVLLWYEVRARRGQDLLLAPLLVAPLVRHLVAAWFGRRLVCAFAGFLDDAESRVGCLVHPARTHGEDLRKRAAFQLLRGFGCGSPDYLCSGARNYETADASSKRHFELKTNGMNWYAYGLAASAFDVEPGLIPGSKGDRYARDRLQDTRPARSLCPSAAHSL